MHTLNVIRCHAQRGHRGGRWLKNSAHPQELKHRLVPVKVDDERQRIEQQVWIKAEWRSTETGRMTKFYSLTRSGRKQLEKELATWARLSAAINVVVQEV